MSDNQAGWLVPKVAPGTHYAPFRSVILNNIKCDNSHKNIYI